MYKGTTGMSRSWGNKLAKGRILNMRAQQQGDSGYDAERRGFAIDARSVNENFRAMQTLTWSSARQMLHTVYVQAINISQYTYSHCSLMSASSLTLRLSFLPYDLLAPNTVFIIKVLSHIPRLWALTSASANGNAPMISKSRSATESISRLVPMAVPMMSVVYLSTAYGQSMRTKLLRLYLFPSPHGVQTVHMTLVTESKPVTIWRRKFQLLATHLVY
ncbi:hypothetical protein SNK03_004907 [Fusarium graminearum]|uniref:Chromosome 2, complete genome n=1 Tax=Gibberella zeae (strain ATCC MYA-4620 / CBS 123657 / FGSC 9075 / NRRL 31084 / PH-1) TaxID=229533 RepID=A0A0E0S0F6_GIBZE|nr:hypothetical protein FG05_13335 [Fusarium graminearum]CEF76981.1 unnamed protein product [Fusarium graminearum]